MTFKTLIIQIAGKWKIIGLLNIVLILAAFVYCYSNPPLFKSSVSFLVINEIDGNANNSNEPGLLLNRNPMNLETFQQVAKSTEMFEFLINEFDLYNHYQINKQSPLSYEIIVEKLSSRIKVSQNSHSCLMVTIYDEDKDLAAKMVNGLFEYLDKMTKEYAISNLQRKIKIYDKVLANSRKHLNDELHDFSSLLGELKSISIQNKSRESSEIIYELNVKLAGLTAQLSEINLDLSKTVKNYEISLAVLDKENLANIKLINKGLRDTRDSLWMILITKMLKISIIGFLLILGGVVIYIERINHMN